jgi:hypothetical protein
MQDVHMLNELFAQHVSTCVEHLLPDKQLH